MGTDAIEQPPQSSFPTGSTSPAPSPPPTPGKSAGGDPAAELEALIASAESEITDLDDDLKAIQHRLAQKKAEKSAMSAFLDEWKSSSAGFEKAKEKATAERAAAQTVLGQASDVAGRLAPEHVTSIQNAVATVDGAIATKRSEVQVLTGNLAADQAAELKAKADTANAKAAFAEAKRKLGALAKSVENQTGRVKSLSGEASDAIEKDRDSLAYLLIRDLGVTDGYLETLIDPTRIAALKNEAHAAWKLEKEQTAAEAAAGWKLGQTKEQLKKAEGELAALDKNRRKKLEELVDAANSGGSSASTETAKTTPAPQPTSQPAASTPSPAW